MLKFLVYLSGAVRIPLALHAHCRAVALCGCSHNCACVSKLPPLIMLHPRTARRYAQISEREPCRSVGQGFLIFPQYAKRILSWSFFCNQALAKLCAKWNCMKHRPSQLPASVICKKKCFMRLFLQYDHIRHRLCVCTTGA